jgi:hypothetical protein
MTVPECNGMNRAREMIFKQLRDIPAADVVEVVRCKYCKHRIVNEHYGEKGYIKLKAYCELDTGDIFSLGRCAEDDNWFCADGKRKGGDE